MKKNAKRYDINKQAKVGEEIICPVCGSHFVKRSYQQAFCCILCKDKYNNQRRKDNGYFKRYNLAHPERLERAGISTEFDADICLGDDDEGLAQITLDPECREDEELERFSLGWDIE